jgi:hypothetical protein
METRDTSAAMDNRRTVFIEHARMMTPLVCDVHRPPREQKHRHERDAGQNGQRISPARRTLDVGWLPRREPARSRQTKDRQLGDRTTRDGNPEDRVREWERQEIG